MISWNSVLDAIRNGEPVSAEVANRAVQQLASRTEYLKVRQDTNDLGRAIFVSDAPISIDVKTGHVVYFDEDGQRFAPAYADLVLQDGQLVASPSSNPVGIVVDKQTANSATIVMCGLIDPTNYIGDDCSGADMRINLLPAGSDAVVGTWFLAAGYENRGMVTRSQSLVTVPVCQTLYTQGIAVNIGLPSVVATQALKVRLPNKVYGPDIVFKRIDTDGSTLDFDSPHTDYYSGSKVAVFSTVDGGLTIETILMTGTACGVLNDGMGLVDVETPKELIQALSDADGDYSAVFKAKSADSRTIMIALLGDDGTVSSGPDRLALCLSDLYSCYVAPATKDSYVWALNPNYIGIAGTSGWAPATVDYFPASVIPPGAKFGYKFDGNQILEQLFPESVVGSYFFTKSGVGLSQTVAVVDSYGIWWFDDFDKVPWDTVLDKPLVPELKVTLSEWDAVSAEKLIRPGELFLHYSKLVAGGVKVVTQLTSDDTDIIAVVDPTGNPASTGPLVLRSNIRLKSGAEDASGSVVVKSINGFEVSRGPVVEKLVAGDNITVSNDGQGTVMVGVAGLDGKLEGDPDLLNIDDLQIERDASMDIFYAVMPPGRTSAISGRVAVPMYLGSGYVMNLCVRLIALHSSGTTTVPALSVGWTRLEQSNLGTLLSTATTGTGSLSAVSLAPRMYKDVRLTTSPDTRIPVTAGQTVYFTLRRSASDGYVGKIGIIALRYEFTKVS